MALLLEAGYENPPAAQRGRLSTHAQAVYVARLKKEPRPLGRDGAADGVCLSCPGLGGAGELREAGRGFASRDQLKGYYTTADPERNLLLRALAALPGRAGRYAAREAHRRDLGPMQPVAHQRAFGWDLLGVLANRVSGKSELHRWVLERRDRSFDRMVSRDLGPGAAVFIVQAGSCSRSMAVAQQHGMRTVVNWNIQHWEMARAEHAREVARNPKWAPLFTFREFPPRLISEWETELEIADLVLTPSSAVVDSFVDAGYPAQRFLVIPYGVDADRFRPDEQIAEPDGALQVICLGEIGQRKGISYFFEVARRLPHVRFTAVGWRVARLPEQLPANVTVTTNVPDVRPFLQRAHVLLFPSLVDGFGLVVLQAMACGLPVICSHNAGARDVIANGTDGWVVPPRDTEQMVERLRLLDGDRALLADMSQAARDTALEHPWERFHAELAQAVQPKSCVS